MSSIRYLLKKIISFFKTKEDVANLIIEKELHSSKVIIGENFTYRKYCILRIFRKGILEIGDRVFINSFSTINCFEQIKIGNDTIIGENVKIYDHNHSYDNKNHLKIERDEFTTAPINIGKNCWIGSNVTILKGVTIGDNVIVGANCLIYKSIPSNTIVKLNQSLIIETTT